MIEEVERLETHLQHHPLGGTKILEGGKIHDLLVRPAQDPLLQRSLDRKECMVLGRPKEALLTDSRLEPY